MANGDQLEDHNPFRIRLLSSLHWSCVE